jgi:salicylate hydroxylase
MRSDPLTASLINNPSPTGWLAPGRHAVATPVHFGDSYGMIVVFDQDYSEKPSIPEDARNWETKGDIQELRGLFADHEPRFRKLLDLIQSEDCRLWRIGMLPNLERWVSQSGMVVVVGDAAHAMHPYLAQVCSLIIVNELFMLKENREQLWLLKMELPWRSVLPTRRLKHRFLKHSELLKAASEFSGREKHYPDGEMQMKRDAVMKASLGKQVGVPEKGKEKLHPTAWVHGYDVRGHVSCSYKIYFIVICANMYV